MSYVKTILLASTISFFTACSSGEIPSKEGGFYHSGIYFGAYLTKYHKKGIVDGCTTAKGYYRKSNWLFKKSKDYNYAWFVGRNRCRKLLRINSNNDLVS